MDKFKYDYQDACGDELAKGWGVDDDIRWSEEWQCGNGMNMVMMLERGSESAAHGESKQKKPNVEVSKIAGEHGRLTATRRAKPIRLQNKYSAFQSEAELGEETGDEITDDNNTYEHTRW